VALAIVAGALANKPRSGGEAWVRLSWLLGLRRLGFDTVFAEQIAAASCVDEAGRPADFESSLNRAYFEAVVGTFGLRGQASLLCDGGEASAGLDRAELSALAAEAELLVNISGNLTDAKILAAPRTSLYVDLDPGFTQAWHADPGVDLPLREHDHYATVGLNVGRAACPIPTGGLSWIATPPPVVLSEWPSRGLPDGGALRLTTVANWRSHYGSPEIAGRTPSAKHHQFRRLIELPERLPGVRFELALAIHPGDRRDRDALRASGWTLVDPHEAASTPQLFRRYLAGSGGELSVAHGVYSESGSGWFSDRTAAYLASGRPAIVQETGISETLPTGQGLLTFGTPAEAVEAVRKVVAEYEMHAAAARDFAERHLDSDRVLARLLAKIGVGG
jgi:hypothetical protein